MEAKLIHSLTGGPTRPPPKAAAEALRKKLLPRCSQDTHTYRQIDAHTHAGERRAHGGATRPPPKTLPKYRNIQTNRHTHTNTHVDTQTHRHADTQTQTPRRTYTHADKHTDRHAHKHTDTHKQYGHAVVVTRFPFITKTGLYFRSFLEVPKY